MIDINELRRLAQAATPHVGHACKYQDAHWLREGHVDFENADLFIASERPQEDAAFYAAANPATVIELLDRLEAAESDALEQARLNGMGASREAALMAKLEVAEKAKDDWLYANAPGGWIDALRLECDYLRARIETAEKERDEVAQQLVQSEKGKRKISEECDALRAKIEAMGQQEPVAWLHETRRDSDVVTNAVKHVWGKAAVGSMAAYSIPLYTLPGAKGE